MAETINNNVTPLAVTDPIGSSDQVWFGEEMEISVTDKINEANANIAALQSGKANVAHTHEGYANATHTHVQSDVSGLSTALAAKADASHTHSGYASSEHTHTEYADADHTHSADDVSGLATVATSGNYEDLTNKPTIPAAYTHPTSHPASMIEGLADVATSGSYDDLTDKPTIPTVPTSLPANGGNADTVDNMHASDFASASHNHDSDYADIEHTHTQYAAGSHTHAQSEISGLETALNGKANTSHAHSNYATVEEFETLETTVNGKANASHTHSAADLRSMASALFATSSSGGVEFSFGTNSDKNILTEINGWSVGFHTAYAVGGTEGNPTTSDSFRYLVHKTNTNIGWILAFDGLGKVYVNYEHNNEYRGWRRLYDTVNPPTAAEVGAISKALQFTSDTGDVKENLTGKDVLATIKAKAIGFYTFYAESGTTNNPQGSYGYRYVVHKTDVNHGWVLAFGSDGSIFTNYLASGSWLGWKTIHDATPTALWLGAKVMTSGETITPTKKLSECRNGWMLEWSDYNADSSSSANTNFVNTPIFKRYASGDWDGKNMMFPVPNYLSDDGTSQSTAIKQLIVYDNKLVGHVANNKNTANLDVCLRAVYEF